MNSKRRLTASGMNPNALAEMFGGKIVFDGDVDTQHVLPKGSLKEVRTHARKMMNSHEKRGGYILAPSQILWPDTTLENIVVMNEAAG